MTTTWGCAFIYPSKVKETSEKVGKDNYSNMKYTDKIRLGIGLYFTHVFFGIISITFIHFISIVIHLSVHLSKHSV